MLAKSEQATPEMTALAFANAVVAGDYGLAHTMLSASLQATTSAAQLGEDYNAMIAYAGSPAESTPDVGVIELDEWTNQKEGNTRWVYVSISNDYYCEAVSVVVAREQGQSVIRELDWGRP